MRLHTIIGSVLGVLAIGAMAACEPNPVKVDNKEGIVSSVGPVTTDADGLWSVSVSVFDNEGDPVDVHAQIAGGDDPWSTLKHCSDTAAPCLKQPLRALSTRTDGSDEQHTAIIDAGGLALSKTSLRMYALEDQSDMVVWPAP